MAECGKYIGGTTSFPCTIEEVGHPGPCMAKEVARSVRERADWERAQERVAAERAGGLDEGLGQFQGPPQTFAERMGERNDRPGATPLTTAPTAGQSVRTFEVSGVEPLGTGRFAEGRAATVEPEGLRLREGDQPLPIIREDVHDIQGIVIQDIATRREVGIKRYGTPLQSWNGRDSVQDAFEEALDLTMYLRQIMAERADIMVAINELEQRIGALFADVLPPIFQQSFDLLYDMLLGKNG